MLRFVIVLGFCLALPKLNLLGSSIQSDSSIIDVYIFDRNYTCFDSLAKDRVIDSALALKECREVITGKNETIASLMAEFVQSQNNIIKYRGIIKDKEETDKIRDGVNADLKSNNEKLERKIKKTKFKSGFFGSLSTIVAAVGGYLIGKKL